jgi:hypothetical protein
MSDANYRYNQTIKLFGADAEPAFETPEQQEAVWGRCSCTGRAPRWR